MSSSPSFFFLFFFGKDHPNLEGIWFALAIVFPPSLPNTFSILPVKCWFGNRKKSEITCVRSPLGEKLFLFCLYRQPFRQHIKFSVLSLSYTKWEGLSQSKSSFLPLIIFIHTLGESFKNHGLVYSDPFFSIFIIFRFVSSMFSNLDCIETTVSLAVNVVIHKFV